jgi:DNA polymerase-4
MRKIIHIDMDAFFASIEQRDNEAFRGKPLAVGYAGQRGVVAAASYEARRFGVYSAMPSQVALRKCPHIIFTPPRFHVYKEVSNQIRSIFLEYTDLVEPLSLDEAFLDVTFNHKDIPYAIDVAKEIKQKIFETTQLTASAGISINKFLAKIASDYNKPNGLYVIGPKSAEKFVEELKIEKFFGIGKKTAERMHEMQIFTGLDLKQKSEEFLMRHFGKFGKLYHLNAQGIDNRVVNPNHIRKSLGAERTFREDTDDLFVLREELEKVTDDLFRRTDRSKFRGKTVTLKVKYSNFTHTSRSKTLPDFISDYDTLQKIAFELLELVPLSLQIRLIGLSIKNNDVSETELKENSSGTQLQIPFEEHLG